MPAQVLNNYDLGEVEHVNWKSNYDAIRLAAGYPYPSYLLHESCNWSDYHQQWFFLPRRASKEAYDAELDETRCGNILIRADENFNDITVTTIGELDVTRGFSAFRFIPNTNDSFIVATKTSECPTTRVMKSYVTGKEIRYNIISSRILIFSLSYRWTNYSQRSAHRREQIRGHRIFIKRYFPRSICLTVFYLLKAYFYEYSYPN